MVGGSIVQLPAEVLDGHAAVEPLVFVVGLEHGGFGERLRARCIAVQVIGVGEDGEAVELEHGAGVGVEEGAVGLEVDTSARAQELRVARHEKGGGEALGGFLHLRVGEGNPYLVHLGGREEEVDYLDVGPQKRHVGHALLHRLLGTRPHTCALDVDADVVAFGVRGGKPDGVVTPSAPEFEHDGMVVVEEGIAPMPRHGVGGGGRRLQGTVAQGTARELEDVGERLHLGEFAEFVLSHWKSIKN